MSTMRPASFLVVALLLGGAAQPATACKCAQNPDAPPEGSEAAIAAELAASTAVFTGRVVTIESRIRLFLRTQRYLFLTRGDRDIAEEDAERLFRRRVKLEVEESFKGASTRTAVLYTGWGGGDCGYRFERGSRYLVYARDNDGGLYTGICHATKRVEEAAGEIPVLRGLAGSASGG